jgi:hypothetical protein
VSLVYGVDDLRFTTSYWYEGADFDELERRHGVLYLRKLLFHLLAFEANKAGSLRPDVFDPGPYADLATPRFNELWSTVFRHVWGQWRYENDLPEYQGPELRIATHWSTPEAVEHELGEVPVLSFCGGGKDSLVAGRMLEAAGVPYASFAYSSSVYGAAHKQHALLDGLADRLGAVRRHRMWIFDDFLDSPVVRLRPDLGVRTLTAAETPSSVFAGLPVALTHGYALLGVAHERSADHGNLVWNGEEVNHQWGKSLEAERLLQAYVHEELAPNVTYASLLKPLTDPPIFAALQGMLDAVPATHSCNVEKPWCERCAKCAYVWINYMAYLPVDLVRGMFRTNLLDTPENEVHFREMLGLAEHTPFECVGQVDEARLAFALAQRKGVTGRAMELYDSGWELPAVAVDVTHHALPGHFAAALAPQWLAADEALRGLQPA